MQISELLCRAEYIMRATAAHRRLSPTLFFHPRLAPALDEMLQLSAPPAYPRQLHFAINLRYRTCDRIRRERARGPANFESEVGERGLRHYSLKSISKENVTNREKRSLNLINKRFNL